MKYSLPARFCSGLPHFLDESERFALLIVVERHSTTCDRVTKTKKMSSFTVSSMVASTVHDASAADSVIDDQNQNHVDTLASAMFRDDLQQFIVGGCCADNNAALEEVSCLSLDFVHEVVIGGTCLESPVNEFTFVPPKSQVEVSYDGETNTIVSSGIEESVDEVMKPTAKRKRRSRVSFLRTGNVLGRMLKRKRRR
jgi:hypothetical protein